MKLNSKLNLFLVALLVAMFSFSSCEKNGPENNEPNVDEVLDPFAMVYSDFINSDDVQIVTSDTSKIAVSTEFVKKLGVNTFDGRTVSIWRTIDTPPFFRKIKSSSVQGDKLILTTVRGEMSDMFEDLDVDLESDIYVNRNYTPVKSTRGATGLQVNDVSGKYIDQNGVLHPAVVIIEPVQAKASALHKSVATRAGVSMDKNYYTAEELLGSNLQFDFFRVRTAIEFSEAAKGDDGKDSPFKFMGAAGVEAHLSAKACINISRFKLKQFEVGLEGGAKIDAKFGVGLEKKWEKEWEHTLMTFGKTHLVFWVGPIPVPFTIEPKLVQSSKVEAAAKVQILSSACIESSFKVGCAYENKGWHNKSEKAKFEPTFVINGVNGSASVGASVGLYISTDILLAGSVGPELSVGPALGIEGVVETTADSNGVTASFETEAYVGVMGEMGAKAKFFGYDLGKWKTDFTLFKVPILNSKLEYSYGMDGFAKYEAEWTALSDNILKSYSSEGDN